MGASVCKLPDQNKTPLQNMLKRMKKKSATITIANCIVNLFQAEMTEGKKRKALQEFSKDDSNVLALKFIFCLVSTIKYRQ